MVQVSEPAERRDADPMHSTAVPAPESIVNEPNMLPAPEPIEPPIQNSSIPAVAAAKSKIAFDELGGLL